MINFILAAGSYDFKNTIIDASPSQLLTSVNGRPIISWVINNILKNSRENVLIVTREDDNHLNSFLNQSYRENSRVQVVKTMPEQSILFSLQKGLEEGTKALGGDIGKVRVCLGDTLLLNTPLVGGDAVYVAPVSDSSEKWCLIESFEDGSISALYDKVKARDLSEGEAAVGRYQFEDGELFFRLLKKSISLEEREISDVILRYLSERTVEARSVKPEDWIDFGHVEGIADARHKLTVSRHFNSISFHKTLPIITKRSSDKLKLKNEVFWYQNVPSYVKSLTPQVLGFHESSKLFEVDMEFYGYPTLTETLLYKDRPLTFWNSVLNKMFEVVKLFGHVETTEANEEAGTDMYYGKTFERVNTLIAQRKLWKKIIEKDSIFINGREVLNLQALKKFIKVKCNKLAKKRRVSLIHGDLCFNNILYDSASGVIKLIDPRGSFGGGTSVFGDSRYDVAKLRHSFCGGYDFIVEGMFDLYRVGKTDCFFKIHDHSVEQKKELFDMKLEEIGFDPQEIRFIESLLFLSMIPLHSESLRKQMAFYLNAIIKLNDCFNEEGM